MQELKFSESSRGDQAREETMAYIYHFNVNDESAAISVLIHKCFLVYRNTCQNRYVWMYTHNQQLFKDLLRTLRTQIPLNIRAAVGLMRLEKGTGLNVLGRSFGIGKSNAHRICEECDEALCKELPHFIKLPSSQDEGRQAIQEFKNANSIPC